MATVGFSSTSVRAHSHEPPSLIDRTRRAGDNLASHRSFRRRLFVVAGDSLIAALAATMAWLSTGISGELAAAATVTAMAAVWPFVLACRAAQSGDQVLGPKRHSAEVTRVLVGLLGLLAIVGSLAPVDLFGVPLAVAVVVLHAGSVVVRASSVRRSRALCETGEEGVPTLVVGPASSVAAAIDRLAGGDDHRLNVVSACVEDGAAVMEDGPAEHHTPVDSVLAAADEHCAHVVCVTPGSLFTGDRLRQLGWALEDAGIELVAEFGLTDVAPHRLRVTRAGASSLVHVRPTRPTGLRLAVKQVCDRVGAVVALMLLAPVFVMVALAVRASGPGPVLYRQVRVGRDNLMFTMVKFRTMHVDADLRRADLLASTDVDGPMFKMRRDPRITRVGRMLRRYSLDELPQLINVLRGEMSLVGPRPPLPEEVARYNATEHRRLRVIPGMTGLWQVSGRSNLAWDETVRLDLRYADNWTLGEDVRLLGRTAGAVVRGHGAY